MTMGFFEGSGLIFAKTFNVTMDLIVLNNKTRNPKYETSSVTKQEDEKKMEKIILGDNFGYRYGYYKKKKNKQSKKGDIKKCHYIQEQN